MDIRQLLSQIPSAYQAYGQEDNTLTEFEQNPDRQAISYAPIAGAGRAFVDLPLGLSEFAYNTAGRVKDLVDGDEQQFEYTKFPRPFADFSEQTREGASDYAQNVAMGAEFAGGFAGGMALGQTVAGRMLYAQPLENAIYNTASKIFTNPQTGSQFLNQAVRTGSKIFAGGLSAGTANIVADTGFNVAEATDEDGNFDQQKFWRDETASALFGAVVGGGLNLLSKADIASPKSAADEVYRHSLRRNRDAMNKGDVIQENLDTKSARVNEELEVAIDTSEQPMKPTELVARANGETNEQAANNYYAEKRNEVLRQLDTELDEARHFEPKGTAKEKPEDYGIRQVYEDNQAPLFDRIEKLVGQDSKFMNAIQRYRVESKLLAGYRKQPLEDLWEGLGGKRFFNNPFKNFGERIKGKDLNSVDQFAFAIGKNNLDGARGILLAEKNGAQLVENFDKVINTFKQIGNEAVELGVLKPENVRENYWARWVKDPQKFQAEMFNRLPDHEKNAFQKALADAENAEGTSFNPRQKAEYLDSFIRERATLSRRGNLKNRRIEEVELKMLKYYHDPITAARNYMVDITEQIEKARLLKLKDPKYKPTVAQEEKAMQTLLDEGFEGSGEALRLEARRELYKKNMIKDFNNVITDENIDLEVKQIQKEMREEGKYDGIDINDVTLLKQVATDRLKANKTISDAINIKTRHLQNTNQLKNEDAREFVDLMRSGFINARKPRPEFQRGLSKTVYTALLGNPMAALTQFKDITPIATRYGIGRAFKDYFGELIKLFPPLKDGSQFTLDKAGLDDLYNFMLDADPKATNLFMDVVLTPMKAVDQAGGNTTLNSSYSWWVDNIASEKGLKQFQKRYGRYFTPEEAELTVKALIDNKGLNDKGELHWGVKNMIVHETMDMRPTDVFDKPKKYLDNPDNRIAYDLMNFSVKRRAFLYREFMKRANDPNLSTLEKSQMILGRTASFLALTAGMNIAVESAKDKLRGRDPDEVTMFDAMVNASLDAVGLNQIAYTAGSSKYGYKTKDGKFKVYNRKDLLANIANQFYPTPLLSPGATIVGDLLFDGRDLLDTESGWTTPRSLRYIPVFGPTAYGALKENESGRSTGGGQVRQTRQSRRPRMRRRRRN